MVYIILGNGFEEIEAVTTCDILRRGDVPVCFVSLSNSKKVEGAHGITIISDVTADSVLPEKEDYFVIPGGVDGVNSIKSDKLTMRLLESAAKNGCGLAAICAGPSVLASLGLLDGRNITCFPGCEKLMGAAVCKPEYSTINDEGLITGRSPGSAIDFGLALLEHITCVKTAEDIRGSLVY